jgi:DNA-binding transcriptional LysR family regulator
MPIDNWDYLRVFMTISRMKGISAASRILQLDHSTVARRLATLEEDMGTRLVDRLPTGIRLTAAGSALFAYVERMEVEVKTANLKLCGVDKGPVGVVRISSPEALGIYVIAPHIRHLQKQYPDLQVELIPEAKGLSLSRREADIAVVLTRPPRGRLHVKKLIEYRLGLYASRDYLAQAGEVSDAKDLQSHTFVSYIDDLIGMSELRVLEQVIPGANVIFRSSSIIAQQFAVTAGIGIGLLHCFAASTDQRLIPLLADKINVTRTYWMAVHSDQRALPRISTVLRFLEGVIDANRARIAPER